MQKLLSSMNDVEVVKDTGDANDLIGYGALSQVRKVRHKANGKHYALKEMDLKAIHPNDIKNITREIKTHIFLDHPNIVKLYDNYTAPNQVLYLLLEFCDNNNLFHFIQKSRIDEKVIHKFFYQTVQAIEYIHKRKIMHRDLKPENILLDKNFNVKVCDFGWCAEYNENERRQTFCGTNEYMAPEILDTKSQDFGIDIWALGILLYEMYHKRAPFTGRSPQDIMKAIKARKLVFSASPMCQEAKDIIDKILQINPKNRLSIEGLYAHPYFHKFPFFRLMTNDSKAIAAKNSRSSYVGIEEGKELMNTLGKKIRAPSPGRAQANTVLDQKSIGMHPIKITSYKDSSAISNPQPITQITGSSSLQSSTIMTDMRPKAATQLGSMPMISTTPMNISSSSNIRKNSGDWTPIGQARPQIVTGNSNGATIIHQMNVSSSLGNSQIGQNSITNMGKSFSVPIGHGGTIISSSNPSLYDFGKTLSQPSMAHGVPINDRSEPKADSLQGARKSSEREKATIEYLPYRHDSGHSKEEEKSSKVLQPLNQQSYTISSNYQNSMQQQNGLKDSTTLTGQSLSSQVLKQPTVISSANNSHQVSGNYQATSYMIAGQVISTTPHNITNGNSNMTICNFMLFSSSSIKVPTHNHIIFERSVPW